MRHATIRRKRLRAVRIVDDFMRMPRRIIPGLPDYRAANQEALQDGRMWAVQPGKATIMRLNEDGEGWVEL